MLYKNNKDSHKSESMIIYTDLTGPRCKLFARVLDAHPLFPEPLTIWRNGMRQGGTPDIRAVG